MKRLVFLLPLLSLVFFPGCGSQDPEKGSSEPDAREIAFFTMQLRPSFDDYFHDLFDEFEKSHPGVKIKWLDYPAQDYDTKLLTSFMGSHPPDVINLTPQMLPRFVSRNILLNLDETLPPETMGSYFPNILKDACQIRGTTYALPWYLATAVTMCNMEIFHEAGLTEEDIPKTYQEMREIALVIKEKTDKFAFFPIYTETGSLRGYLEGSGVPTLDEEETRALFNTPRGIEVLRFWSDFYKEGLAPSEALTAMHRRPIELYKSGRLAIFHSGPQFLKHVKSDSPDVYQNTVVRPCLHWEGHEVYSIDVHNIVVSSKSKYPGLASEFAAFVTNAQNQLEFCRLTTIIPSVISASKDPYFTQVEETPEGLARKIAAEQIAGGNVSRTPLKNSGKLYRALDDVMEKVCLGDMTPEEGLKSAEEKWNEILQD